MQRVVFTIILTALLVIFFSAESFAQRRRSGAATGALIGGATGALIGGATSSRSGRGALIGGAVGLGVGSVMGSQADRRRGNYYWYNGRCWIRFRNGEFHPVANRYCR